MLKESDQKRPPLNDNRVPIHAINPKINAQIALFHGNLETLPVPAIVNAAKRDLQGGGGLDASVHNGAGPQLALACRKYAPCDVGEAVITGGFELPARAVIHSVGPNIPQGKKPTTFQASQLQACYINSLNTAATNNLPIVAFPAISAGSSGYPPEAAAYIACVTVRRYLETNENKGKFRLIIFCMWKENWIIYGSCIQAVNVASLQLGSLKRCRLLALRDGRADSVNYCACRKVEATSN